MRCGDNDFEVIRRRRIEEGKIDWFLRFTFAASMALATVMNCWGERDRRSHRLRKVWSDPDLRFEISTPFSRARTFHPSQFPLPLFESDADNSSCMQLSLANRTYLLSESSLIDLILIHFTNQQFNNQNKFKIQI